MIEIAGPSRTSRGSYSSRNVQRPGPGTATAASRPPCRPACGRPAESAPATRLASRPIQRPSTGGRRAARRSPSRAVGLDRHVQSSGRGDRPPAARRVEHRQEARGRPTSRPGWLIDRRRSRGRARPGRRLVGPPDGERSRTQSPCSATHDVAIEPAGQGRVVDRLAGVLGPLRTWPSRFSTGSKMRSRVPVARSAARTIGSDAGCSIGPCASWSSPRRRGGRGCGRPRAAPAPTTWAGCSRSDRRSGSPGLPASRARTGLCSSTAGSGRGRSAGGARGPRGRGTSRAGAAPSQPGAAMSWPRCDPASDPEQDEPARPSPRARG